MYVAELLSFGAVDQFRIDPFFLRPELCAFDCLFLYVILELIAFHLDLIKQSDLLQCH